MTEEWLRGSELMRSSFPGLTERQRFVVFMTLRVGGSFSTYAVRSTIPNEPERLLLSHRGNCSDYAVRLAMVLDSVDIETALIPVHTPSLPGHFIVDAYDPQDSCGYLLDSLFHVILIYESAHKSFISKWIELTPQERLDFFESPGSPSVVFLPTYFRYVDAGAAGLERTPFTLRSINSQTPAQRKALWRKAMTSEWPAYLAWWKDSYPDQPPRTLAEIGKAFEIDGLIRFAPAYGVNTAPLWKAAGLDFDTPAMFQRKNMLPPEE